MPDKPEVKGGCNCGGNKGKDVKDVKVKTITTFGGKKK